MHLARASRPHTVPRGLEAPSGAPLSMSHFQVELSGKFEDYKGPEDKILKRAFMSGFPSAKYKFRGQEYFYDFKKMLQRNVGTGKERKIRPPHKLKAPAAPIAAGGKTKFVKVPPGSAGKVVYVKHPGHKGEKFPVAVPATAGSGGGAMLVPVPEKDTSSGGWSTGAKVAAGGAAAVGLAGAAVGGVMLADHLTDGDAGVVSDLADGIEEVGADAVDAVGEAAEDVVDWVGEAGGDVGDFFMDLF